MLSIAARRRALLMVLLAGGCGDAEPSGPSTAPQAVEPAPAAPDQNGPYRVGVLTFEIAGPEGRTLPVEVWYPAEPAPGAAVERYALRSGPLVLAELTSPRGASRDAAPDRRGAPYPTVVFSHGSGGARIQSVYLCEHLASHGFVVAAPDHIGNTVREELVKEQALPQIQMARLRPLDVSRTLDVLLERTAAPGDALGGLIDGGRVGVAGHSFGAFTALRIAGASADVPAAIAHCKQNPGALLCKGLDETANFPASARDPRFRAALPQAPGGSQVFQPPGGKDGFTDIAIPTMIQAGTTDETTPYEPEAAVPFKTMPAGSFLLSIERAGHFTFSDICALDLGIKEFDDGCGKDNIDPAQAQAQINLYAAAFFQHFVAGRPGFTAYLEPGRALAPGVASFQVK